MEKEYFLNGAHKVPIIFVFNQTDGPFLGTIDQDKELKLWNRADGFALYNKSDLKANVCPGSGTISAVLYISAARVYISCNESLYIYNIESGSANKTDLLKRSPYNLFKASIPNPASLSPATQSYTLIAPITNNAFMYWQQNEWFIYMINEAHQIVKQTTLPNLVNERADPRPVFSVYETETEVFLAWGRLDTVEIFKHNKASTDDSSTFWNNTDFVKKNSSIATEGFQISSIDITLKRLTIGGTDGYIIIYTLDYIENTLTIRGKEEGKQTVIFGRNDIGNFRIQWVKTNDYDATYWIVDNSFQVRRNITSIVWKKGFFHSKEITGQVYSNNEVITVSKDRSISRFKIPDMSQKIDSPSEMDISYIQLISMPVNDIFSTKDFLVVIGEANFFVVLGKDNFNNPFFISICELCYFNNNSQVVYMEGNIFFTMLPKQGASGIIILEVLDIDDLKEGKSRHPAKDLVIDRSLVLKKALYMKTHRFIYALFTNDLFIFDVKNMDKEPEQVFQTSFAITSFTTVDDLIITMPENILVVVDKTRTVYQTIRKYDLNSVKNDPSTSLTDYFASPLQYKPFYDSNILKIAYSQEYNFLFLLTSQGEIQVLNHATLEREESIPPIQKLSVIGETLDSGYFNEEMKRIFFFVKVNEENHMNSLEFRIGYNEHVLHIPVPIGPNSRDHYGLALEKNNTKIYISGDDGIYSMDKCSLSNWYCPDASKCKECDYFSLERCTKCPEGYKLDEKNNCIEGCPPGTLEKDGHCLSCNNGSLKHCYNCSTLTTCEVCYQGTYFKDGSCYNSKCPKGSFETSTQFRCQDCSPLCETCTDAFSCASCKGGQVLTESSSCQFNCPVGFFKNASKCTECPSYCNKCDTSIPFCDECNSVSYLSTSKICKPYVCDESGNLPKNQSFCVVMKQITGDQCGKTNSLGLWFTDLYRCVVIENYTLFFEENCEGNKILIRTQSSVECRDASGLTQNNNGVLLDTNTSTKINQVIPSKYEIQKNDEFNLFTLQLLNKIIIQLSAIQELFEITVEIKNEQDAFVPCELCRVEIKSIKNDDLFELNFKVFTETNYDLLAIPIIRLNGVEMSPNQPVSNLQNLVIYAFQEDVDGSLKHFWKPIQDLALILDVEALLIPLFSAVTTGTYIYWSMFTFYQVQNFMKYIRVYWPEPTITVLQEMDIFNFETHGSSIPLRPHSTKEGDHSKFSRFQLYYHDTLLTNGYNSFSLLFLSILVFYGSRVLQMAMKKFSGSSEPQHWVYRLSTFITKFTTTRVIFVTFPSLFLHSILQISNASFEPWVLFNTFVAIVLLGGYLIMTVFIILMIRKENYEIAFWNPFVVKQIMIGVPEKEPIFKRIFPVKFFIIKPAIIAIILVVLSHYPRIQIICLCFLFILLGVQNYWYNPYKHRNYKIITIISEFLQLIPLIGTYVVVEIDNQEANLNGDNRDKYGIFLAILYLIPLLLQNIFAYIHINRFFFNFINQKITYYLDEKKVQLEITEYE